MFFYDFSAFLDVESRELVSLDFRVRFVPCQTRKKERFLDWNSRNSTKISKMYQNVPPNIRLLLESRMSLLWEPRIQEFWHLGEREGVHRTLTQQFLDTSKPRTSKLFRGATAGSPCMGRRAPSEISIEFFILNPRSFGSTFSRIYARERVKLPHSAAAPKTILSVC